MSGNAVNQVKSGASHVSHVDGGVKNSRWDRPRHINLARELRRLCSRCKEGSYATQAARKSVLTLCANQLKEVGVFNLSPEGLKQKHVKFLLERWTREELGAGTIKNRLAHLRWWSAKVGKQNLIPRDNDCLGIERRQQVTNQSKAVALEADKLAKITDERLRCSLELQREFGLRREESIKFQPAYADQGDKLVLKGSWTKGGRPREIPIRTESQKHILKVAHRLAGGGSMIPADKKYVEQLHRYEWQTNKVGLNKLHGLRHGYAQARYKELTGRECPALGGKTSKELSSNEKRIDRKIRIMISRELGHEREEVTAVYLGR